MAGSGKEEPECIVDACDGPDGGAGVGDPRFLIEGDGRRESFDLFNLRFLQFAHELPGKGGKRAQVAAFGFPIQYIKDQGGFSRTRDPCDHDEPVLRKFKAHRTEVVFGSIDYFYGIGVVHGANLPAKVETFSHRVRNPSKP